MIMTKDQNLNDLFKMEVEQLTIQEGLAVKGGGEAGNDCTNGTCDGNSGIGCENTNCQSES